MAEKTKMLGYCLKLKKKVPISNAKMKRTFSRGAYRYSVLGTYEESGVTYKVSVIVGADAAEGLLKTHDVSKDTDNWES